MYLYSISYMLSELKHMNVAGYMRVWILIVDSLAFTLQHVKFGTALLLYSGFLTHVLTRKERIK